MSPSSFYDLRGQNRALESPGWMGVCCILCPSLARLSPPCAILQVGHAVLPHARAGPMSFYRGLPASVHALDPRVLLMVLLFPGTWSLWAHTE
jgi:hypothetical protein